MPTSAPSPRRRHARALPGFGLTLGTAITYLGLVVLLPLSALLVRAATTDAGHLLSTVSDARVLAAVRLSLGAALAAAAIDAVVGLVVAWSLVRYRFPARKLLDALVDLPFALPTAVSGIALTTLLSKNGWVGQHLEALGVQVAFTRAGIVVALAFIGLPFVVRTLQPAILDLEREQEEVAATLGAPRARVLGRVVVPALLPALLTGFTLAFARGIGEYGSVIFIAGNMPMRTEIAPLLIVAKLEQYDVGGATAIAVLLLALSFALLVAINALQAWTAGRRRAA